MYKHDDKKINKYFKLLGRISLKDNKYSDKYIEEVEKIVKHKGGALLDNVFNSFGVTSMKQICRKIDYVNKILKGQTPAMVPELYYNFCNISNPNQNLGLLRRHGFYLPNTSNLEIIPNYQPWHIGKKVVYVLDYIDGKVILIIHILILIEVY